MSDAQLDAARLIERVIKRLREDGIIERQTHGFIRNCRDTPPELAVYCITISDSIMGKANIGKAKGDDKIIYCARVLSLTRSGGMKWDDDGDDDDWDEP